MRPAAFVLALLLLAASVTDTPATARTLLVGPEQPYTAPSAAARAAQDGDVVLIEPGDYYDCAVWTQDHLVIAGASPGVVITDSTCQGKAVFVVTGRDTTIRDLTLARARVLDRNGAGIRQENQNLTLHRVRFVNNEVGLIDSAAGAGASVIRISGCVFEAGGVGGERPSFAVFVGAVSLLRIEGSTFKGVKGGQIGTAAARTELVGNRIDTGTGEEPAVAVISSGGHLVMQDNLLSIGPKAPRLAAGVLVTGEDSPELRRNRLLNKTGRPAALLLDWTGMFPVLQDNVVEPGDTAYSTDLIWRHRASVLYHGVKDEARAVAGQFKRGLLGLLAR